MTQTIPLSILDLASVREGFDEADSFQNSKNLIQMAERTGYTRYWVAEHHGMAGVASSATSILLGYLAAQTSTIRIGSGGIMLPNHAPLVIAEQFGTLATLFPDRVDLGLGRAPGTDMKTARALRRDLQTNVDKFPAMIEELQNYFSGVGNNGVQAIPGHGKNVPLYLLGSSTYSAHLAADMGLPFAFASHFAPDDLNNAFYLYRQNFRPSAALEKPYAIATLNVIVGETNEEAQQLATSAYLRFLMMARGVPGKMPKPIDDIDLLWSPYEKAAIQEKMRYMIIGDAKKVKADLLAFTEKFKPDELVIVSDVYDPAKRLASYQMLADVWFE